MAESCSQERQLRLVSAISVNSLYINGLTLRIGLQEARPK